MKMLTFIGWAFSFSVFPLSVNNKERERSGSEP